MVSFRKVVIELFTFTILIVTASSRPDPQPLAGPNDTPTNEVSLSDIDPSMAPDRNIALCEEVDTGYGLSWQTICTEPWKHQIPSGESGRAGSPDITSLIHRLNDDRAAKMQQGGYFHFRTEIHPDKTELVNGYPESTVAWCNSPGGNWHPKDACQLCNSINNNYIVPKAYIRKKDGMHMCVCKKWGKGDEQFQACNCDLCDAWLMPTGIRDQCRKMRNLRARSKYLSSYAALDSRNSYFRQYNNKLGVGKAHDWVVGDVQADQSVCKSGIQGKGEEEYDGHLWADEAFGGETCPGE